MKKWNVLILCLLSFIYMNTDTATSFSEDSHSVDAYLPHAKEGNLENSPSRCFTLKQKAKLCKKQLTAAEQSLALAQKDADALHQKNQRLAKKKDSLKKQLASALQEKKEYEEKYKHIETQNSSSQAADHTKNQLIADLRKQLEINNAEMKSLKAEMDIAQSSCRTAFSKVSKRDQGLEATKKELKNALNQIADLKTNLQLAQNEHQQAQQALATYNAQKDSHQALNASYKAECQVLTERLRKAQEDFNEAQNKILANKDEIMRVNHALTLAQSSQQQAQQALATYNAQEDSRQALNASYKVECQALTEKLGKAQEDFNEAQNKILANKDEIMGLNRALTMAQSEQQKAQQELSAYNAQEDSREKLIASYKAECKALNKKLEIAHLELAQTNQLSQEINRIKTDYEESRVMCATLQKKLLHVQENFTEAQNKILESKEEIMGLHNALTLAQSQEKLAQSQLAFIQKTHDSSQHHVAELAQENKELRTTLFTVQNNLHTAQTDFNKQNFSFKSVQDQLQYALNDKKALEEHIAKLESDHETACAEVLTAKNSYNSLKTELELAHNKNSSLQSELEKLGTSYSSTRKDLELAHNQYGTLEKHFNTANNEFDVIKTNLSTLQENNESLQAKLEETNSHYENLQAQLAKPARAHNKIILKKTVA